MILYEHTLLMLLKESVFKSEEYIASAHDECELQSTHTCMTGEAELTELNA